MKRLFYLLVFVIAVKSNATRKPLFLPQLPVGEYKINMIAFVRCELSTDRFKFNYHLSKTSVTTAEIKGNATFIEPLDGSFNVEINLAVKDSVGGWRDNAHIFKTSKACSTMKIWGRLFHLVSSFWITLTENLGMHSMNCPLPAGCYISPGMKLNSDLYSNLPKQSFYGTYRFRFQITKNKIVQGCGTSVIEVKRVWETD